MTAKRRHKWQHQTGGALLGRRDSESSLEARPRSPPNAYQLRARQPRPRPRTTQRRLGSKPRFQRRCREAVVDPEAEPVRCAHARVRGSLWERRDPLDSASPRGRSRRLPPVTSNRSPYQPSDTHLALHRASRGLPAGRDTLPEWTPRPSGAMPIGSGRSIHACRARTPHLG